MGELAEVAYELVQAGFLGGPFRKSNRLPQPSDRTIGRLEVQVPRLRNCTETLSAQQAVTQASPTDERDKLAYELLHDIKKTQERALSEFNERCGKEHWRKLGSVQGLIKAADRYAKRNGKPSVPRRKKD
jgi:hypothetical protein